MTGLVLLLFTSKTGVKNGIGDFMGSSSLFAGFIHGSTWKSTDKMLSDLSSDVHDVFLIVSVQYIGHFYL